jgi:hypothetical protein
MLQFRLETISSCLATYCTGNASFAFTCSPSSREKRATSFGRVAVMRAPYFGDLIIVGT